MVENDIFKNQKDVVENLKGSATNLGVDPNKIVPPEPKMEKKTILLAKKNCKSCWGQGVLTVAGNDVAVRTKELSDGTKLGTPGEEGTVSIVSECGKFKKTEGRNSSKPEPVEKKLSLMYCRCVRQKIVEVPIQET